MTELPAAEFQADILVVDDNQANLRLLTDVLSSRNYRVHEALNGPEALRIAQSALPDLVLLDISMPGMDGFEVCTRLKADVSTRDIPVIFISALSDIDDVVRGFEVGGVDYILPSAREVLARTPASLLWFASGGNRGVAPGSPDARVAQPDENEFIRMATHDRATRSTSSWATGPCCNVDGRRGTPGADGRGAWRLTITPRRCASW